jgi:hypothetical protein
MTAKETGVSFSGNVDHTLGDSTAETSAAQITDRPSSHIKEADESTKINRDLAEPEMHVLRVDQPATGKSSMLLTLVGPKKSRLPATFEEAVAEQHDRAKRQIAGNCPPTRPISKSR